MFFAITLVLCLLAGYGMGTTSNGMTTGRTATNFWAGPLSAIFGAAIGLIAAYFVGDFASHIYGGAVVGLVAGLAGLGVARRRMHR